MNTKEQLPVYPPALRKPELGKMYAVVLKHSTARTLDSVPVGGEDGKSALLT